MKNKFNKLYSCKKTSWLAKDKKKEINYDKIKV